MCDVKQCVEGDEYNSQILIDLPQVYGDADGEQIDREFEKERNDCSSVSVQFPERLEVSLPSTSSKEVESQVRAAVVLVLPLLANHGTITGTETYEEAGDPEANDRDRGNRGLKRGGWIG